jgi:hypothetical protein
MSGVFQTSNMANVIRQELYTSELQARFSDWLLGMPLFNDRTSEFGDGDAAFIDQVGQRTLREYVENSPIDFSNIDLSRIQLRVTEYLQDGFAITDKAKQDSWKADMLWAKNVEESTRAFERQIESDVLATCNQQVLGNANLINGHAHRAIATGTDETLSLKDIAKIKLAFDKARVAPENRVLLIDPSQEYALNQLVSITQPATGDIFNKDFMGIIEDGFGNKLNFIRNIYGFNIMISHNLPVVATETIGGDTVTDAVCNIAMSMAGSDAMPFMGVIRQQPTGEFERNGKMKRDEYSATARWGFAIQRPESLYVLLSGTDITNL